MNTLRQWLTRINAWSHYLIARGGRPAITGAATYGALEGVNTLVPLPGGRASRVAVSALAAGTAEGVLYAFGNEPSIKASYLAGEMKKLGDAYVAAKADELPDIRAKARDTFGADGQAHADAFLEGLELRREDARKAGNPELVTATG